MKKNILFISYSNNDVDYFLPLIAALMKDGSYEPLLFLVRTGEEAQFNRTHVKLINEFRIRTVYFYQIMAFFSPARFLIGISRYCSKQSGMVPLKELLKNNCFLKAFLKLIYVVIDKIFKYLPRFVLSQESLSRFINENNVGMIVVDHQMIKKNPPYEDFRSYAVSIIVFYAKDVGIPVFMMPHGAATIADPGKKEDYSGFYFDPNNVSGMTELFKPDILALSTNNERTMYAAMIGDNTKVFVLGSIRYDYSWSKRLEEASINDFQKTDKDGYVILYLVSPLGHDIETKCFKDMLGLLERFPRAQLWVKNHPRYPWRFRLEGNDKKGFSSRLKIFRNDTDSNALLVYSDLIVCPLSSMLYQAISDKKPVIFYDWWRKYLNFSGKTVFDDTPCVLRASSREELYDYCQQVIDSGPFFIDDAKVEAFYKINISCGLSREESIVAKYLDVVKCYSK